MADLKCALPRLTDALRRARYSGTFDVGALASGDPAGFLPLLHFALLGVSRAVAVWLSEVGSGLTPAMSDARFVEAAHRALRDHFNHRPVLTVQQLLAMGFAEQKMLLVLDVLQLCRSKHAELLAKRRASSAKGGGAPAVSPSRPSSASPRTATLISSKPRVVAPPSPIPLSPRGAPPRPQPPAAVGGPARRASRPKVPTDPPSIEPPSHAFALRELC